MGDSLTGLVIARCSVLRGYQAATINIRGLQILLIKYNRSELRFQCNTESFVLYYLWIVQSVLLFISNTILRIRDFFPYLVLPALMGAF